MHDQETQIPSCTLHAANKHGEHDPACWSARGACLVRFALCFQKQAGDLHLASGVFRFRFFLNCYCVIDIVICSGLQPAVSLVYLHLLCA
jgi:hypothetical protein